MILKCFRVHFCDHHFGESKMNIYFIPIHVLVLIFLVIDLLRDEKYIFQIVITSICVFTKTEGIFSIFR